MGASTMIGKIAVIFAVVAFAAAAPLSLYEQQAALYEEVLMETSDDDNTFSKVVTAQKEVYDNHNGTVGKHNAYETVKRLKPFKVSAARDAAEKKEADKQDKDIAAAKKSYLDAQNATLTKAENSAKAAAKEAKETREDATTKVHKILHDKDAAKEKAENQFLKGVAKMAEGRDVIVNQGNEYEPGKVGDQASKMNAKATGSASAIRYSEVVPEA